MASYLASCCIRPGIPWSSHDVLSVDGIVAEGRGVIMSTVV